MTYGIEDDKRKFNLYLSGDITITSNHRRQGQNYNDNLKFRSHERKGFVIKKSTRRNLTSSAFLLFIKKIHRIIFLTLTFPEPIKPDVKINPMLNRFITNMKKNYGMESFLWTREDTKKGRPHFHILADMPYQPIQKINNAWCKSIDMYSGCAVRLPENSKAIINDIDVVCRYITKYITKRKDGTKKPQKEYFSERCYSISQDIMSEAIRLQWFDVRGMEDDIGKDLKYRYHQYATCIKIWDFFKKSDYFVEILGNYTEIAETLQTPPEKPKSWVNPYNQLKIGFTS